MSCWTASRSLMLRFMSAPNLAVVAGIHQLNADREALAALRHPAGHDGADAEPTGRLRDVSFLALEPKDGIARFHLHLRQLREVVDEAFGDAVAQVFRVRIAAGVDERQHGERIDRLGRGAQKEERESRPSDRRCRRHCGLSPAGHAPDRLEPVAVAIARQALEVARSSAALWYRVSRSFSVALLMMRTSSSGSRGFSRSARSGARFRMASNTRAGVSPQNARRPVAICTSWRPG